jgi:hypothetical protein
MPRSSVRYSGAPDDVDCGNQDPLGGTRTWNHQNPASLAGPLARSPGPIGRHAGTTHLRERAPPRRRHRGRHPAHDARRKRQPQECPPSAPARSGCSCTVTIRFGGPRTLGARGAGLRPPGAQVTRAAARRFNQIAWPTFAVLVATGIWNTAAEQDKITRSYRTTLIAKLAAVLVPGVTAFLARPLAQHRRACGRRRRDPHLRAGCPASRHPAGRLSPSSQGASRGLLVTVTRRSASPGAAWREWPLR